MASTRTWGSFFRRGIITSSLAVGIAAALASMTEIDRLVAQVATSAGGSWRLAGVGGFAPWLAFDAWPAWRDVGFPHFGRLILAYAVIDVVFVALYTVVAAYAIRYSLRAASAREEPNVRAKRRTLFVGLGLLAGADVGENALMAALGNGAPDALIGVQVAFAAVKWIALLALVLRALFGETIGRVARPAIRRAADGVYGQRLGAVSVVAVAAMTILTGSGVQDQLPDVFRGGLGYPEDSSSGFVDIAWGHVLWAALVALVVAVGLFYFGRQRGHVYIVAPPRRLADLASWAYVALGIAFIALTVTALLDQVSFEVRTFAVFIGVIVAIPAGSAIVRARLRRTGGSIPPPFLRADVRAKAPAVFRAGDVVVAAWIAIVLLAPYVALVTPVALNGIEAFTATKFRETGNVLLLLAVFLLVLAVVLPALAWATIQRYLPPTLAPTAVTTPSAAPRRRSVWERIRLVPPRPVPAVPEPNWFVRVRRATLRCIAAAAVARGHVPEESRGARVIGGLAAAIGILAITAFAVFPFTLSRMGPIAVVYALLGSWISILGWLILALGRRRPPEVFGALRLRSTPVIALAVVVPLVIATAVGAPGTHAVRFEAGLDAPERPSMQTAFTRWLETSCVTTVQTRQGNVAVRPLALVAAQGGGIRAAAWTVDVLRELPRASTCAADSVFFSSGTSGGSVGLAHLARAGGTSPLRVTIGPVSGADALSADAAGLLAGDLVAELTGLMIPSQSIRDASSFAWRDRAALQADVWEDAIGSSSKGLGTAFDGDPRRPVGYAVFNSTDSATNCKVVVSQLRLSVRTGGGEEKVCTGTDAEFSNTVDLFDHLGEDCGAGMTWATAALLSARFPFVSPSGRVAPSTVPAGCSSAWDMQLLDGGLVDNSALGTVSDAFGDLGRLIRAHNADPASDAVVVPVVLFVSNEPGSDIAKDTSRSRPELIAPIAAIDGAAAVQSSPAAWLTRLSSTLDDVCADTRCEGVVAEVRDALPGSIVAISPSTTPSITVPLGWSLSDFSRSRLRVESDRQRRCGRDDAHADHVWDYASAAQSIAVSDPACRSAGEYGRFGTFLNLFDDAVR